GDALGPGWMADGGAWAGADGGARAEWKTAGRSGCRMTRGRCRPRGRFDCFGRHTDRLQDEIAHLGGADMIPRTGGVGAEQHRALVRILWQPAVAAPDRGRVQRYDIHHVPHPGLLAG